MIDGFGCYPLCIEIDLDSYDGPWTHVARFRRRSGWLLVANAAVSIDYAEVASYPVVVACDEYGEAIPDFMAPNLLACACSHPQLCNEFPPDELEEQLELQSYPIRRRWMRETNSDFAELDARASRDIEEVEGQTAAKLKLCDRQIADLRRRRRMLGPIDEARSIFDSVIAEIEMHQVALLDWLDIRRSELRRNYDSLESELFRRMRPLISFEQLYRLNWHDGARQSGWEAEDRGAYRHTIASEFTVDRVQIPIQLASIEAHLAALRGTLVNYDVRYEISALNKRWVKLKSRLAVARASLRD